MSISGKPKASCAECHFLTKIPLPVLREDDGTSSIDDSDRTLNVQERERLRKRDLDWLGRLETLGCHFGVWGEGPVTLEELAETDRTDFCFFWKHRPGMLFPAAEILQKREADNREAARDRRLTIIGLWVAVFALLAQIVLTLASPLAESRIKATPITTAAPIVPATFTMTAAPTMTAMPTETSTPTPTATYTPTSIPAVTHTMTATPTDMPIPTATHTP